MRRNSFAPSPLNKNASRVQPPEVPLPGYVPFVPVFFPQPLPSERIILVPADYIDYESGRERNRFLRLILTPAADLKRNERFVVFLVKIPLPLINIGITMPAISEDFKRTIEKYASLRKDSIGYLNTRKEGVISFVIESDTDAEVSSINTEKAFYNGIKYDDNGDPTNVKPTFIKYALNSNEITFTLYDEFGIGKDVRVELPYGLIPYDDWKSMYDRFVYNVREEIDKKAAEEERAVRQKAEIARIAVQTAEEERAARKSTAAVVIKTFLQRASSQASYLEAAKEERKILEEGRQRAESARIAEQERMEKEMRKAEQKAEEKRTKKAATKKAAMQRAKVAEQKAEKERMARETAAQEKANEERRRAVAAAITIRVLLQRASAQALYLKALEEKRRLEEERRRADAVKAAAQKAEEEKIGVSEAAAKEEKKRLEEERQKAENARAAAQRRADEKRRKGPEKTEEQLLEEAIEKAAKEKAQMVKGEAATSTTDQGPKGKKKKGGAVKSISEIVPKEKIETGAAMTTDAVKKKETGVRPATVTFSLKVKEGSEKDKVKTYLYFLEAILFEFVMFDHRISAQGKTKEELKAIKKAFWVQVIDNIIKFVSFSDLEDKDKMLTKTSMEAALKAVGSDNMDRRIMGLKELLCRKYSLDMAEFSMTKNDLGQGQIEQKRELVDRSYSLFAEKTYGVAFVNNAVEDLRVGDTQINYQLFLFVIQSLITNSLNEKNVLPCNPSYEFLEHELLSVAAIMRDAQFILSRQLAEELLALSRSGRSVPISQMALRIRFSQRVLSEELARQEACAQSFEGETGPVSIAEAVKIAKKVCDAAIIKNFDAIGAAAVATKKADSEKVDAVAASTKPAVELKNLERNTVGGVTMTRFRTTAGVLRDPKKLDEVARAILAGSMSVKPGHDGAAKDRGR